MGFRGGVGGVPIYFYGRADFSDHELKPLVLKGKVLGDKMPCQPIPPQLSGWRFTPLIKGVDCPKQLVL